MGKSIVIKGADFAVNAIRTVTLSPIHEEITDLFIWTNNISVQINGDEGSTTFYKSSGFVDVSRYAKIVVAQPMYRVGPITNGYPAICFYDQNKTVISGKHYRVSDISGQPSTEMYEYILPEGTKYIRTNYFLESYEEQWPEGHFLPFRCIGYIE